MRNTYSVERRIAAAFDIDEGKFGLGVGHHSGGTTHTHISHTFLLCRYKT
jgi:hypothetical protein